jgi:hypothetical protein
MKKRDKTSLQDREKKISCLFNPDFLQRIKQRHFSGRLHVVWKEGDLRVFDLSSKLTFKKSTRMDPDYFEFFDFDDEF